MKSIKEQVLEEVDFPYKYSIAYEKYHLPHLKRLIDLTTQKMSVCSNCNKKKPWELMSVECPDCYLKGFDKERQKICKMIEELKQEDFGKGKDLQEANEKAYSINILDELLTKIRGDLK